MGLKGWGRKPGGCSGKSDVTGVIILGFCRALPGKFCRAWFHGELLCVGFYHLHSLPRPFPPFLVHRAGISPFGDVWDIQINPAHVQGPQLSTSRTKQHPHCELLRDTAGDTFNNSSLIFFFQVNMDLWFFVLLLGSGLISVGAHNDTTGKPCSSSPHRSPKPFLG